MEGSGGMESKPGQAVVSPEELLRGIIGASKVELFLPEQKERQREFGPRFQKSLDSFKTKYRDWITDADRLRIDWVWSEPIFLNPEDVRAIGYWEEVGILDQLKKIGDVDPDLKNDTNRGMADFLLKETTRVKWMFGTGEDQKPPRFIAKPYTPGETWMMKAREEKIDGIGFADQRFILIVADQFEQYSLEEGFLDILVWEETAHIISHLKEYGIGGWWLEECLAKDLTSPFWRNAGNGIKDLVEMQRDFSGSLTRQLNYLNDLPLRAFFGLLEKESRDARVVKEHTNAVINRLSEEQVLF